MKTAEAIAKAATGFNDTDSLERLRRRSILLLCDNSQVGGVQRYTLDLIITARERGVTLEAACFVGGEGRAWLHDAFAKAGIPLHDIPFEMRRPFRSAVGVASLARELNSQIVIGQGYRTNFALGFAKLTGQIRARCFAIQHGMPQTWFNTTGIWNIYDFLTRWLWAKRNISVAAATARSLHWFGWWGSRSVVIRNFARQLSDAPVPALRLPGAGPCIGYAGRLVRIKGVFDLLEAFAILRRTHPTARLAIAGGGGAEGELRALARSLNLEDGIHWLGVLDDLRPFFSAVDFTVLPTYTVEGIPLIILEAFLSRRAVVATPVGGVPEIVRHGDNGYLVPPRNPERLASQLAWCLDHPADVARAGKNAREYAHREHSAEAYWAAMARALDW